jgi:predicted metal-dependent hydrolase
MTTAHAWQDHPILPRKAHLPFSPALPRYWMGGSRPLTHLVNGLNLLFPKGERFFIRSVRAFMDEARDNPALYEQLRGFMAQEVRHGIEHERFFEILQAQGFDLAPFLDRYERLAYHRIEPAASPRLRLATTAALEHFTAIFGDFALATGLPEAHPELRDLLLWHAAEEIEHKCVAFDLLQIVDDRYALRAQGLAVAILVLAGFWTLATLELAEQDRRLPPPTRSDDPTPEPPSAVARRLWRQGVPQRLTRGFLDYLRPDFHPSQHDNLDAARRWLEAHAAL